MLTKVDVATMAASVEARCPLLDRQVVELAAALPPTAKIRHAELKHVLRRLASRYLPPEVAAKPKWGFVVPVDEWLRGPSAPVFEELLIGETARARGLFDYDYVKTVWAEHTRGRANHKHRLWSLVCLELWFRMFVDGTLARGDGLR
jgi:asparagine synthase (glutamine-hydrolysing)